jgi:hypothetical protein
MSVFDPYVERFLPGTVKDMHIPEHEGPVTTTFGETFCVFYVRFPEDGDERVSGVCPEILYRKDYDSEYMAGRDFGRMMIFAGEHRKERPPEGVHPAEVLQFEENRDRALTDIIRAQVAFENHPDLSPEEIVARGLDRPPSERS